jgi:hypothetical protein
MRAPWHLAASRIRPEAALQVRGRAALVGRVGGRHRGEVAVNVDQERGPTSAPRKLPASIDFRFLHETRACSWMPSLPQRYRFTFWARSWAQDRIPDIDPWSKSQGATKEFLSDETAFPFEVIR